ncbi:hypothetical protein [Streptomyces lydicamycinicus]|uniref:hypothetical protein n=1 Tax=Streptomyces lydicamycinicus TaxID=1546107 RepID=UPI003C2ADE8F
MHPTLITSQPTRLQRFLRRLRRTARQLVIGTGLIVLGLLVFAIRCLRPVINVLATWAARIELEISIRTGLPSVGATLGAHLTHAFTREFRAGWTGTEHERTAR